MKKGIILISIGIILLALDIRISVGDAYPSMEIIDELGHEIQGKIINNIIGTSPKIDIISDVLGYAFLLAGALFLLKYDSRIIIRILPIPLGIYLYITTLQLPYNFELRELYLKAAGYHFLLVLVEILTEFFIVKGVINIVQCTQTKWNVNELYVGLALALISKGVLAGIHFFFGRGIFYFVYSLVMIGATVFYLNRLYVITKFKLGESS
jgi:hypothetical protein